MEYKVGDIVQIVNNNNKIGIISRIDYEYIYVNIAMHTSNQHICEVYRTELSLIYRFGD